MDAKMEICELDEAMEDWGGEGDPYEALRKTPTKDQRVHNYNKIVETINFITSSGRITEDWMYEHGGMILVYRDWIPNYNLIDPETESAEFRKKCYETEVLMSNLVESIQKTKTFNVKFYLMLLQHMKWLTDQETEDEELMEMFEGMGM